MPGIHIFTEQNRARGDSLVMSLARHWRRDGLQVGIGPAATLDADIGIMHIDRTWIAPRCLPSNPHHRPLLNARVLNISKRRISRQLLAADSRYDGQVIVKTDANYRGIPELRARAAARNERTALPRFYAEYEIFDRLANVPEEVWQRRDLVVERFIPEREGDNYVLRSWVFFGEQEYNARITSAEPVVKLANVISHEFIDDVPDELRQTRASMGFDFGKFDYVIVDGEVILFDVNKTPSVAYSATSPRQIRLARGIYSFLSMVS